MKYEQVVDAITTTVETITKDCDAFEPLLDPDARKARLTAAMTEAGFGPGGRFEHVPQSLWNETLERTKAADDARLGRALADVEDDAVFLGKWMPEYEERLKDAPSVLDVIRTRCGPIENSPTAYVNAHLLDLMAESVITPKIANASIAEARQWYGAALRDPVAPRNAAVIAAIETRIRQGTFAVQTDPEPGAPELLQDLSRQVHAQRESRVPNEIKRWRGAVARANKVRQQAQAAGLRRAETIEQAHLRTLQKLVQG